MRPSEPFDPAHFEAVYREALRHYLGGKGEAALAEAYSLGRQAVVSGVSLLAIANIHHQAVAGVLNSRDTCRTPAVERMAAVFFSEVVAPFEMALRGFEDTLRSLRELNDLLEQRVADRTQDLETAVKVRDDFLSVASHELRTPLAALQLTLQLLQTRVQREAADLPTWLTTKVDAIERQVKRLTKLVTEMLDVSRIMSGHIELQLQWQTTDLRDLVRDVAERFADQAADADCDLLVEAPDPVVGCWDRSRVDQALSNLVSNAIKFGAGAPIVIRLEQTDGEARLAVTDHGIGIAPADQPRLFQRFERLVSTRNFGGLGLGLWLSRNFIEAMHGRIDVRSQIGKGSTFTITLPLAPDLDASLDAA